MTEQQEERLISALEKIACAMASRLEKDYPLPKTPREALVTKLPSDDDELRQSQGATGESLDEWTSLGPREKEFDT